MDTFFDLQGDQAIWFALIVLTASYIRGFSGFGFTAVLLTGSAFFLPIVEIVPLSIALELTASSVQARGIVQHVKWPELAILLTTGIVCTPIGVFLLGYFDNQTLRLTALLFIFGSSLYLVFAGGRLLRFSRGTYALAGSAIGVVNGATALSGLVLALLFSLSNESAAKMRATMIAYLFAADLWAFLILMGAGYYDSVVIARAIASLPLLAFGVWLGSRHFSSAQPQSYRKVVLCLLLVLSAAGVAAVFIMPSS